VLTDLDPPQADADADADTDAEARPPATRLAASTIPASFFDRTINPRSQEPAERSPDGK
jgi:hypothetical protein